MDQQASKQKGQEGRLSSEEAIALMRLIAGESIDRNMLNKVPGAFAKIIPVVLDELVKENKKLQSDMDSLEENLKQYQGKVGQQDKRLLEVIQQAEYEKEDLAGFSPQVRELLKDYFELRRKMAESDERSKRLSRSVSKLNELLEGREMDDDEVEEISSEIRSLARRLVNYRRDMLDKLARELRDKIQVALETGKFDDLPEDLKSDLADLVVNKLENIVKPYNELSNRFVAGEISREEFSENLQQNTLLQHLRDRIISDIVAALSSGRLDSPDIPDSLRMSIRRLIATNNLARSESSEELDDDDQRRDSSPIDRTSSDERGTDTRPLQMGETINISPS